MMGYMHCPKQPTVMIHYVQAVKQKIFGQKQQYPIGIDVGNFGGMILVKPRQNDYIYYPKDQINAPVEEHEQEVGKGIAPRIKFLLLPMA